MFAKDAFDDMICSDQVLEGQYRDNIKNLFLSKGAESALRCVFRRPQWADPVPVPVCENVDSDEILCADANPGELSSSSPIDSSYMSNEDIEVTDRESEAIAVGLKSVQDVQKLFARKQTHIQFHITQSYSHGPLLITENMFEEVCKHVGIFPRIKDVILYMGARICELEVAPPKVQLNMCPKTVEGISAAGYGNAAKILAADHLQHAEIAYCLRYVELNGREDAESPWSLRQFTVYQRAGFTTAQSSWLFVSLPPGAQEIVAKLVIHEDIICVFDMLRVHHALISWAVTRWRPYLAWLTEILDGHTSRLFFAEHGQQQAGLANFGIRQRLKQLEDYILDTILALKATRSAADDVAEFLATILTQTKHAQKEPQSHVERDHDLRYLERNSHMAKIVSKELGLLLDRADSLHQKLKSSISLLSSFLDLESGYTLQTLSKAAQEESKKMEKIATRSMKDAAAVKLLTIIMLVYLPITIVLNFFSTQFVTTRPSSDGTTTTSVDHGWTVMLAVAIPLTFGTVGIWWLWTQLQFGALKGRIVRLWTRQRQKLVKGPDSC